jgi:tetratricopeptide (TPR) repeat protein
MKKEELRYDPVHDRIAAIVDYVDNNKNIVIQVLIVIVIAVGSWGYYSALERDKVNVSKSLVGVAQNAYNSGQRDLSIAELNSILTEYSGSDAAAQALVYLIKDAYGDNRDETVLSLGKTQKTAGSDYVVNAGFYETLGNADMNMGNIQDAINSFRKADKLSSTTGDDPRFKINLAIALIAKNDFTHSLKLLGDIVNDESISFSDKSKIEELLAFTKFKMDN